MDGRRIQLCYKLAALSWGLDDIGAVATGRHAADLSEIERRRLFEPSPGELRDEAAGRIFIYEGLRDTDIKRAMEEELKRVQTMMFIRVKPTDQEGKVRKAPENDAKYVQDDGC